MSKKALEICELEVPMGPEEHVQQLLSRAPDKIRIIDGDEYRIKGKVLKNSTNVRKCLLYDAHYTSLRHNQLTDTVMYQGRSIKDVGITDMRVDLEERYETGCQKTDFQDMAIWVAHQRGYDPLNEYLSRCRERHTHKSCVSSNLKTLRRLFGSGSDSLVRVVTTSQCGRDYSQLIETIAVCWAVSAIARARCVDGGPSSKVDTCLALVGQQGAYKSSLLKGLASDEFFSDSHLPIGDKDGYQLIHSSGVWIWELGELHSLRGKSAENTKMYLSAQSDLYRPTHARFPVRKNRRLVFTATTNDFTFLSDPTGNRRFWPILIDGYGIDLDKILASRDLFWAEAQTMYDIIVRGRNGDKLSKKERALFDEFSGWWLNDEMSGQLQSYQDRFYLDDPWVSTIESCLSTTADCGQIGATMEDMMEALELPVTSKHSGYARRIADICRRKGAERKQIKFGSKKIRLWYIPEHQTITTKGGSK